MSSSDKKNLTSPVINLYYPLGFISKGNINLSPIINFIPIETPVLVGESFLSSDPVLTAKLSHDEEELSQDDTSADINSFVESVQPAKGISTPRSVIRIVEPQSIVERVEPTSEIKHWFCRIERSNFQGSSHLRIWGAKSTDKGFKSLIKERNEGNIIQLWFFHGKHECDLIATAKILEIRERTEAETDEAVGWKDAGKYNLIISYTDLHNLVDCQIKIGVGHHSPNFIRSKDVEGINPELEYQYILRYSKIRTNLNFE